MTGKPRYGLSWFRISFGRLQLKARAKGGHVLRFEATVHNAKELRCRRSLDNSGQIITRLAGMADRFAAALDCADTGFLPVRQAAYDLRKLRGKQLVDKPGRTRRCHVPPDSARVIAALLALRDHVIAPILAGIRSPRMGRKPTIWTAIDRDYENLRIGTQTLFQHAGIDTLTAAA